jgi:hypothetical protein
MASFSTNPYSNFQAANSKEYISLNKAAKQDFRPETSYDIIPGNSDVFSAKIQKYAAQFGYGSLLNIPSDHNVNASDANTITYKNHVHMIRTWNKISDELIAKNANKVWGTCNWTVSTSKPIKELTVTCGEVTASSLTKIGKKKFMEHWKSTILASQVMALLTNEAQATIKVLENLYQWIDPVSYKILIGGRSILNETLKLMHPDIQTNVYAKLAKIKAIKPVNHCCNMVEWHSTMESKRTAIELKVPGSYHESQYIMDYLNATLTIEVKTFEAEVKIICNRYLCRNSDRWNATYISREIIKKYNNMFEDGTWKCELGKKDQIIALSTKIAELQAKIVNKSK